MKRKTFTYPPVGAQSMVIRESALEEVELIVNVRTAKDQLSSLLEQVERGNQITITSDGRPKAKLVPVRPQRRPFMMDWDLLRQNGQRKGARPAQDVVREERDGRV